MDLSRCQTSRGGRIGGAALILGVWLSTGQAVRAQDTPEPPAPIIEETPLLEAQPDDGPTYTISEFAPRFARETPGQPTESELGEIEIALGLTVTGYVVPRDGIPVVVRTLDALAAEETSDYHASAVQHVIVMLRDYLVAQSLMGVFVGPDPRDLSENGEDHRAEGEHVVRLIMTVGVVTELRTLASGDRVSSSERINHSLHESIRRNSPVRPAGEDDEVDQSLLDKQALDRFIYHLGRHPGRRVDASVAAAVEPGGVALDLLVTENTPLLMYLQVSNTGTRQTDRVRERFGLLHTQLTDNDDVLALDFVTAGFDSDANALSLSYEAPIEEHGRIRWRVFGAWSEFTADQVGFFAGNFVGNSWQVGGAVIANVYQNRELFIDVYGGARFYDVDVDNQGFAIRGQEEFVLLTLGVQLERQTELARTEGDLNLEWNVASLDDAELARLGRTSPDDDWLVLHGRLTHSFYLEPLMDIEAWEDPTTPESSTLAHEILLEIQGQTSFGSRLVPQAEMVAGGLYTVRGYPESAVAGDNVFIARIDYRYHVPRAFGIESEPREMFGQPFRAAPQYVYGRPDWDLVLKGFVDVGLVSINNALSFEGDETLISAGVGMEFSIRRNFNVRLDWGFTLKEANTANVNSGSNRLHVVGTLLF